MRTTGRGDLNVIRLRCKRRAGQASGHKKRSQSIRKRIDSGILCAGEAKAQVVVPVARGVVVAISRPAVPCVVVPSAAAIHPVRATLRHLPI